MLLVVVVTIVFNILYINIWICSKCFFFVCCQNCGVPWIRLTKSFRNISNFFTTNKSMQLCCCHNLVRLFTSFSFQSFSQPLVMMSPQQSNSIAEVFEIDSSIDLCVKCFLLEPKRSYKKLRFKLQYRNIFDCWKKKWQ